jgi:hypothetical protein
VTSSGRGLHAPPLAAVPLAAAALIFGCSSSQVGGGSDASTLDVVHSVHPPPADDNDGGDVGAGDASTCPMPADLSVWTPPAYVPAKFVPGACSADDFVAADTACFKATTATSAACLAFQTANVACAACLDSNSTDPTWGPLVNWSGVVDINIGGCLQLLAPSETACALALQTADVCPHVACDAVCPVTETDADSFTEWKVCAAAASADACASFIADSNCVATDDAAAGTPCNESPSATFDTLFLQIAPLFCGGADGGSGEAGTPEAGTPEAGTGAAGTPEAGTGAAGTPEAGTGAAGTPEAGTGAAGTPDSGRLDAAGE